MRVSYSQREALSLPRSPSNPISHQQSNPQLHTHLQKLEQQIKDLTKMIRSNKPLIQQAEGRRKFYKKICDKQKQKLATADLDMMKEQYEGELAELRQKKEGLQEMVGNIHQQFEQTTVNNHNIKTTLLQNKLFLQHSLMQLQKENGHYLQLFEKKIETLGYQKNQLLQNEQVIGQKEKVRQKYQLVCEEIRRRESGH